MLARLAACVFYVVAAGCGSLEADLLTAHRLYRDAHYEAAQRWLTEVEPQTSGLSAGDRARFYYLRGMCAYRLGQREDARHYLVLGNQLLKLDDSRVDSEGRAALHRALADLLREASPV